MLTIGMVGLEKAGRRERDRSGVVESPAGVACAVPDERHLGIKRYIAVGIQHHGSTTVRVVVLECCFAVKDDLTRNKNRTHTKHKVKSVVELWRVVCCACECC